MLRVVWAVSPFRLLMTLVLCLAILAQGGCTYYMNPRMKEHYGGKRAPGDVAILLVRKTRPSFSRIIVVDGEPVDPAHGLFLFICTLVADGLLIVPLPIGLYYEKEDAYIQEHRILPGEHDIRMQYVVSVEAKGGYVTTTYMTEHKTLSKDFRAGHVYELWGEMEADAEDWVIRVREVPLDTFVQEDHGRRTSRRGWP
jgi:hypothetical protein